MKRKIFAGLGVLCLLGAIGFSIFAYLLYEDNYQRVEEQNEYQRKRFEEKGLSYTEARPDLTVPNIIVIAFAVLSGLGSIGLLIAAVKTKGSVANSGQKFVADSPMGIPATAQSPLAQAIPPTRIATVPGGSPNKTSNRLLIGGGISLAVSIIALAISLVLPLLTRGKVSWDEALLGIVPSIGIGLISVVILVIGLIKRR